MSDFHREDLPGDSYVEFEYYPGLDQRHEFGVFLELGYRHPSGSKSEWTMVEVPRKQARALAKSILRSTKKRSK